ncbi:unnamed protein product [Withania somnifera]
MMAAIAVNVYEGISSFLVILVAPLSMSYFGYLKGILFTNVAFILGLGTLWCAVQYEKRAVLVGSLVLLTFRKAGRDIILKAFLADQLWSRKDQEPNLRRDEQHPQTSGETVIYPERKKDVFEEDEEIVETRRKLYWRVSWIMGIIVATLWLSSQDWVRIVAISTIAMIGGVSVFLFGTPFYFRRKPSPSPLCCALKVVKVALSNRHMDYPTSPSQLFKNYTNDTEILPRIAFLRWLDKAAILEASPPCKVSTEQIDETAGGKVFEVAKVKDVKRLISMCPLWSTFFVSSLVAATTSTFFYEQADSMDESFGGLHVPIVVFVIIMTFTSSITSIICSWIKNTSINDPRRPPLNRIRLGMLCSVLCCLVAWIVEVHRLRKVKVKRLSVFWLTPQFFLVGLMKGLSESGLQDFFETQVCESMKGYGPHFNEFATGIGKLFSAICILIFCFWFGGTVNESNLNRYYAMLLVPTTLNLCFCYLVSKWYANHPYDRIETKTPNVGQQLEEGTKQALKDENCHIENFTEIVVTKENSNCDTTQVQEALKTDPKCDFFHCLGC